MAEGRAQQQRSTGKQTSNTVDTPAHRPTHLSFPSSSSPSPLATTTASRTTHRPPIGTPGRSSTDDDGDRCRPRSAHRRRRTRRLRVDRTVVATSFHRQARQTYLRCCHVHCCPGRPASAPAALLLLLLRPTTPRPQQQQQSDEQPPPRPSRPPAACALLLLVARPFVAGRMAAALLCGRSVHSRGARSISSGCHHRGVG